MIQKLNINNTNIYFQRDTNLPMVDIQLNFRAGSAFDDRLNGLADLAVSLFATKTKSSTEQELINKITDIGASIHAETSKEFFCVKVRILSESHVLDQTMTILREIFTEPDFDENILEREKLQTLTHIDYLHKQSTYLASLEFSKQLFAENPYSHPTIGYKSSIQKITIKDITNFYNKYICASNANICVVGDISKSDTQKLAKEIINSLHKGQANTQNFIQLPAKPIIVEKQFSSNQTSILIGHQLLVDILDPLYFPLKLGDEILGGSGLNSLLFNKVREELGLVYNISSNANINPDYGSFVISAQTSNPNLALKTIKEVYEDFVYKKIDEESVANTKKHIEGTHLLTSVKNSSKLSMLSSIANKELPLDFFDQYVENINSVTPAQINQAFQQIQKNAIVTVIVGDVK
ncbi:insulinase family protein [Allofrancisella guangzhouensis]|uniref:Peptidase M16 n=1 Tax=Allofrancisella guangzhouensis TaxID=594679 RepID=A0A0A8E6M4_9GAMM|nr:pitrilysin family protein [Allofrancisella guangzhouensis]AJC49252.1 peptidase M16 [Allofrancisella guangzhouensis]MBK2027694.1 insulinase family protein [Allofrancisella guangzhouensis]MBK2044892.1 insulinase family protein [Allofrancisella guangzhouensis]MBK2046417.1 insulinase family protein [Allofrancisella guangzhouensis]